MLPSPSAAAQPRQAAARSMSLRPIRRLLLLMTVLALGCLLFFTPSTKLRDLQTSSSGYLREHWPAKTPWSPPYGPPNTASSIGPANRTAKPRAAFVALVRERQLDGLLSAMRDIQWAFNDDLDNGYDYVLLSETPFTDWFKNLVTRFLDDSPSRPTVHFGLVSEQDWAIPSYIDMDRAKMRWTEMGKSSVPYGGSKSYRQMCRFYSGPIFDHPLLRDLEYAWRIEPDTKHLCRYVSHWTKDDKGHVRWVERDPFRHMKATGKKYAWIITMLEYPVTVRSLMSHVHRWRQANPQYVAHDNLLRFISDDGIGYNKCHFWTNFEIVDLSFTRSAAYKSLFNMLDRAGGFFYERWGDAPVRSIAASLLLNMDEVWHIDYAGYHHPPYTTCPRLQDPGSRCACDAQISVDYDFSHVSCTAKWDEANGRNSTEIIMRINEENGMGDFRWKPDEPPYVAAPPRLANS